MNKLTILSTFFIAIIFTLQIEAQSFTFEPGETVTETVQLESYKNIQVDILHPDVDDINFGWVTVENNMLEKWEYSSCDNGGCYSLLPDSAWIGPLADSVPGYIRLTVNPRDKAGTSMVKIYVYDIKHPDEGKFVTFEITASDITAINEPEASLIRIYPNPATNFLNIENSATNASFLELTDLTGKTVYRDFINANQSKSISLSPYPRGIYFIRIDDRETQKIILR